MALILDSRLPRVSGSPWPGVRYFCTTRLGGCSQPPFDALNLGGHVGDDPAAVARNRERLGRLLPAAPLWLNQVHGCAVADAATLAPGEVPEADAAVTTRAGQPLAILVADCLPVVVSDASGTVLGVAHAGWRGLAGGVLENCLAALRALAPAARDWRAWIGPGIGQPRFEVGPEVREAFLGVDAGLACHFIARPDSDRYLADLAGIARQRLTSAGVGTIESSTHCTHRDAALFYSYRRAACTGRQALIAWLVAS